MEWFIDDPSRGEMAFTVIAFAIPVAIVWFGRRRLFSAVPVALAFLLFAAIVIPNIIPARNVAQRNACVSNLRAIQNAKDHWARENHKLPGDIPIEADLYGTNGTNGLIRYNVTCPRGGIYTFGSVTQNPTCSLANKGHRLE